MTLRETIEIWDLKHVNSTLVIVVGNSEASICRQLNTGGKKKFGEDMGYQAVKVRNMGKDVSIWRLDANKIIDSGDVGSNPTVEETL